MTKIDMRDAFFKQLVASARIDDRIVFLSADHGAFALKEFEEEMPDRYINIGIAEQNMVGVAAGLAASGKIVFIYGISPFVSLRVLEQLTIDVAAMQLPVNVISVGAGFTYSTDGPTHQGLQDISAISTIPGMTILNSSDPVNTQAFVGMAISSGKPHYIRIEKERLKNFEKPRDFDSGISVLKKGESKTILISTGQTSHMVLEAAQILETQFNVSVTVIDVFRLKEFPASSLLTWLRMCNWCFGISEIYENFLRHHLATIIIQYNLELKLSIMGVPEKFYFESDRREQILTEIGLTSKDIADYVASKIEKY